MAASPLTDFEPGTCFHPVLGDPKIQQTEKVEKVVFVSGKHAYALMNEREKRKIDNMAIIRLERLCPFPVAELQDALSQFKNAKSESIQLRSRSRYQYNRLRVRLVTRRA